MDRFDATDYERWKDRMFCLLTTLKVAYILNPDLAQIPEPKEDGDELKAQRQKRAEDELIC